jgi:hypothetical protein
MSMAALCAVGDLTIKLRGGKALSTLLRCTISVKAYRFQNGRLEPQYSNFPAKSVDFC